MHRRADAVRTTLRGGRKSVVAPQGEWHEEASEPSSSVWIPDVWTPVSWWRSLFTAKPRSRPTQRTAAPRAIVPKARWVRRLGIVLGVILAICLIAVAALWVLLASGPISFDFATPWLKSAIAENFGDQIGVEVGGTVVERDEHGRAAMRMRDVVVRGRDGKVIASAPKAEIGFSSASLLSGHPRAERLNLVGAELSVRVESDGRVAVSTGADKPPLATTPALAAIGPRSAASGPQRVAAPPNAVQENLATFFAWIDSLGALGLDGAELTEVGLKSGNLVVDDRRNGQQTRFENIHLSLTRPRAGTLELLLGSDDTKRPWKLVASLKPGEAGMRDIDLEADKLSIRDLLLALRIDAGSMQTDAPLSGAVRAAIDPDGTPQAIKGRMLLGPGAITDPDNPTQHIAIDRAEMTLDWNGGSHVLTMPFQIVSGGARMTLVAHAEAPHDGNPNWGLSLTGGSVVLPPEVAGDDPLQLNRIAIRGRFDTQAHRLNIVDAEASGKNVGVAMSGNIDFSTSDPRISIGLASRNMSVAALKQLWPPFVAPPVRAWIVERINGGNVEQAEIATNAPLSTLRDGGPPVPDDGLYIQISTTGSKVRPFDDLPDIREADLVTRIKGRLATVSLGHGAIEMPSGRRLALANGTFEVADTAVKNPPGKVRIRFDGPLAAAAELLNLDRLRDTANVPLDPAATRGNVLATLNLTMPLNVEVKASTLNYGITADIVNFSADRFLLSQRVEAQTLRATANNQGYQIKGEMRVGGAPATVELRHNRGEPDSELKLTGTLDDSARTRLGLDPAGGVVGTVPIKVSGRVAFGGDQDSRLLIETDFTAARIDNLFPGWVKQPGRPARASLTYVGRGKAARFDDVAFEGGGTSIRGGIEFDQNGDFAVATFPTFTLNEGDRASLRLERAPDNLYKATLRGEAFDARAFVKSSVAGHNDARARKSNYDFDLDAKLGSVTGSRNESLRSVDLHLVRRNGAFKALTLNGKFAGDGTVQGELRGGNKPIVILETTDAGALFRFTDIYPRILGGHAWIAMDAPTTEGGRQEGKMEVHEFAVRGEQGLDAAAASVAANAPGANNGVQFTRMTVSFTRSPGKMSIHEGTVAGPALGATIDGVLDYAANEVHMRGTFVPLYGLNSMFKDVPIVGPLLGGNEGLIGSVTYEVVGTPGTPQLHINPISMITPGILRKFMEFPSSLPNKDGGPADLFR